MKIMKSKKIILLAGLVWTPLLIGGGFKIYTTTKDMRLRQSLLEFVEQEQTNIKYARHNLIWEYLDEPSKQVYGDAAAYEKFYKDVRRYQGEELMRDFEIDEENIVVREAWTSPQGVEYQGVYEVPINTTLNDGTTRSDVSYIFKVGNEWKIATGNTKERYEELRDALRDLEALQED